MPDESLTRRDLVRKFELVLTSHLCPSCGFLLHHISENEEVECPACSTTYITQMIESTRRELSFSKLLALSKLQISTTTMSSSLDVGFNPERFVPRKDANHLFDTFMIDYKQLFLLLGEAGFGKTWLVSFWANKIAKEQQPIPTFYVPLRDGLDSFFQFTFGMGIQPTLTEISKVAANLERPIVWMLDGYDELMPDDRRVLLAHLIKWVKVTPNQKLVLSSRGYDWHQCQVVKGHKTELMQILWTPKSGQESSLWLQKLSSEEREAALRRYELPPTETLPEEVVELTNLPLWVRLISEWSQNNPNQPLVLTKDLFTLYFKRMRIDATALELLAQISSELVRGGDLTKELELKGLSKVDQNSLALLNSTGVLIYQEDIFNPSVKVAATPFALFGIAFGYYNRYRSGGEQSIEESAQLLNGLSDSNQRVVQRFLLEFRVPLKQGVAFDKRSFSEVISPTIGEPQFVVKTSDRSYRVYEVISEGDFCTSFRGEYDLPDPRLGVEHVVVKINYDKDDNDLMLNEIDVLRSLRHRSLPSLLDQFSTTDGRIGIILEYMDGVDLYKIMDIYPGGLPQEHVCWILERALSVLGYLHSNLVIHGNIDPGTILVRAKDHHVFLVGYLLAVLDPLTGGQYKGATDGFSAPEVFEKQPPRPEADMYSLGKAMIFLLGGDVEDHSFPTYVDIRLKNFLLEFVRENDEERFSDAWKAWHLLKELRNTIFGPNREFQPLELVKR